MWKYVHIYIIYNIIWMYIYMDSHSHEKSYYMIIWTYIYIHTLVGGDWNVKLWLSIQLGMGISSSQLTLTNSIIFQRGRSTNQGRLNQQQMDQKPVVFQWLSRVEARKFSGMGYHGIYCSLGDLNNNKWGLSQAFYGDIVGYICYIAI